MKKTVLLLAFLAIYSCKNDFSENSTKGDGISNVLDLKSSYKKEFSNALAKAVSNHPELRSIIKDESLKMFDKDYDVLYSSIKNYEIAGRSLKSILTDYLPKDLNIDEIESTLPTLTIMVPELPEGTFSAQSWNINSQIPKVAYTTNEDKLIKIVDKNSKEDKVSSKLIPAYPVIVVKENERIRIKGNSGNAIASNSNSNLALNNSNSYEFIDSSFDNSTGKNKPSTNKFDTQANTSRPPNGFMEQIDDKVIEASKIYANSDGWQRDYVYYDISPTQNKGTFKNDYQEHISYFWLNDKNSLDRILDQNDPTYSVTGWTDGFFEFKVTAFINSTSGAGSVVDKYFPVSGKDLFWFSYRKEGDYYVVNEAVPLKYHLNMPLFNWDLAKYSTTIKIKFEEVDLNEEITNSESVKSTFTTNFGFDIGFGDIVKVGIKSGSTKTEEKSSTFTYKTTKGADLMGDVIVDFSDRILLSNGSTKEYNGANYSLMIYPKNTNPAPSPGGGTGGGRR
ncbi:MULTISPECIES: hypothetical protein [Elizabethkingia]|uniref:hypothetical protein n=1 Tax=Elizabethkingia TaxID=308865 RepID=UPI000999DB2A|nr:hypothetical protein [Elizabethkingia anophelis]OPC55487.1 hypothetical protein BAY06_00975 [Elizabethkingia anophelis]